ncbi:MAG TPA: hypothetical protein VJ819_12800 [Nocardioidaceae bacterium]|nr:hypothetical protein [Nocardioidaceae bacterium]
MADVAGVHLFRTGERVDEVSALVSRLGGAVGLEGVLGDLNRSATVTRVPGRAPVWGFAWDVEDRRSVRWFPQGITTSADQGDAETLSGRAVVCTSWYSQDVKGLNKGARVTFVDVTDRDAPRYRHVLLVEPVPTSSGVDLRPVRVHAGGLVWHGDYLHVAGTARGIYSFRLDDIVRVPTTGDRSSLALHPDGSIDGFGYKYLLPVRFTYDARADDGFERLRYSFLSLDRSTSPHQLVAGEYGRRSMTTRLVRYEIDPETSLLRTSSDGLARPLLLSSDGVPGMQGAAVVHGTYYVTTSSGRYGYGSLYVGQPGAFTRHAKVLPIGPEDITYWPSRDELWSLTEYPARRYVFVMDRAEFA